MLIRKTAKPCLRLTLTVGLAASVSLMSVFLHQPSMAKVLNAVPYESTQKKSTRKSLLTTAKLLSVSNHSSSPLLARNERPGEGPGVRFSPLLAKDERRKVRDQMGVRSSRLTRSLFHYERDNNTPDHLTTVHIDAAQQAETAISPDIFGNFIEHLGGVVYQALWAQLLLNPSLEHIEKADASPADWKLYGAATWRNEGYRSPSCIRLDSKAPSSLVQHVMLPALRVTHYKVTLWARAPLGPHKIRIALVRERMLGSQALGSQALGSQSSGVQLPPRLPDKDKIKSHELARHAEGTEAALVVSRANWQAFHCTLQVPKSTTQDENLWRFVVQQDADSNVDVKEEKEAQKKSVRGSAVVDIDQIEMFPIDNVSGFDVDVLARTRAWGVPLLRWPGGNFASGYDWRDGVGPHANRPTKRNPAWGGVEPNHVGTQEFMTFARLVSATPQLTVNAGDGTPENAAAWVRYCNAPSTDTWGKLRAKNGAEKPFGVRLWEVGNELYGEWQIGHTGAKANADKYVRFRNAMLQADPTLRLIATGKGDVFTPLGLKQDDDWNGALLEAATRNGGQAPDYISLHPLVPLPDYAKGATYAEQYESAMAHPAFLDQTLIPNTICQIQKMEGAQARTRLAITEWGIIIGGEDWRQSPNHDTLAGGLYNALALNAMLRHSDWVTLANMTALLHGGGIKKWKGITYVDPQYYTQQLYAQAHLQTPVATTTVGPGRNIPARGNMPAVEDVPDIDVFAARAQHTKLTVFLVNRCQTDARPLRLHIDNFQPGRRMAIKATILTGDDPRAQNTLEAPDTVRPRPFVVPAWPAVPGKEWEITLPPHALVVLTMQDSA